MNHGHNAESVPPVQALREWASAVRGDWGDIDGRGVKADLLSIADAIEGKGRDWPIERWREDLGLCPSGEGHWTRHCQPVKTVGEGDDAFTYGCGNEATRW